MDEPTLDQRLHQQALRGLARINWLSRSASLFWPPLVRLQHELQRPLRILDLACGGGDVTLGLAQRARRRGWSWQLEGHDVSPLALELASQRAREQQLDVRFIQRDVLAEPLPRDFDVIACSLFLHHLDEATAVELLRHARDATRQLILVNDLARGRVAYLMALIGCRLLTRSPVVRLDGPLSVAGAFTAREAIELAERAGCTGARVTHHWPYRFLLSWRKT